MKALFTLSALFLTYLLIGQVPSNYYKTVEGKQGKELKEELNQIISGHTIFTYSEVWDLLKKTDMDTLDSTKVELIYSGKSIDAEQEYNNGKGWNREHIWPKSRGQFGTAPGPGTDVHALRPSDVSSNSTRGNRSFDYCEECIEVDDTWGDLTNSFRDRSNYTFEPRDEVKGDIARMIFYMVVRYEGFNGEVDLEPTNEVLPSNNKQAVSGVWTTLLKWHQLDPVSNLEKKRNDIIFYNFQKNRNPFIDHPEFAKLIWGEFE